MMYEAKIVNSGRLSSRISRMIEPGVVRNKSRWLSILGEDNFDIAVQSGVLFEKIKPKTVHDKVDVGLDDGDFIVYRGDRGYVMYFGSDGFTWRTEGATMSTLKVEDAKKSGGISPIDIKLTVVKQGNQEQDDEIQSEYISFDDLEANRNKDDREERENEEDREDRENKEGTDDMADIQDEDLDDVPTVGMGGRHDDAMVR